MKNVIKKLTLFMLVVTMFMGTSFAIDLTAPTISSSPKDGSTLEPKEKIKITIADDNDIDEVTYYWKGGQKTTYNPQNPSVILNLTVGSKSGKYVFCVSATDNKGNTTGERTFTYYVAEENETSDNEAPVIKLDRKDGDTVPGGSKVTFTLSDENDISEVTYYWKGGEKATVNPENPNVELYTYLPTKNGKYVLYISATDSNGNSTGTQSYTFYVDDADEDAPEIYAHEKSGSTLTAGQEVVFTITDESKISEIRYYWSTSTEKTLKTDCNEFELTLTVGTKPGKYVAYVTAIDSKGNSTGKQAYTYYVDAEDNVAPTIAVSEKDGSTLIAGQEISLDFYDVSKVAEVNYYWNGESKKTKTPNTNNYKLDLTVGNKLGKRVLYVSAVDTKGNSTGERAYTYYVDIEDNTAPTITVTPANGSTLPALTKINLKISDDYSKVAKVKYNWVGSNIKTLTPNVDDYSIELTLGEKAGKYVLNVEATDGKNNSTEKTFTFYVEGSDNKDNEAPTISANPGNKSTIEPGETIVVTAKDNEELSELEYYWDDDNTVAKPISGTKDTVAVKAPKKEGKHTLYVKVTDEAGNTANDEFIYYVEDDEPEDDEDPEVFADPDGGDVNYGDRITISAEDDGEIEYIEYYWDDDDDDTTTRYKDEFTVKVPSKEGKHYLYVRAKDDAGNMCGWEKFIYNIEEDNYPGNPDITGQINKNVKVLRVEITNADDKIKFEPNEDITYYVDYYNGSSSKVTNAKIEVELPTYLEAKKASDDGKITTKKVTWSLGTLKSGDYGRVSFKAKYTKDDYNEKIITVPAKIYAGSTLKDTSTVRNMIYSDSGKGTGYHTAYCIGYPDGSFRPNGNITRAELAQMVANMEGLRASYKGQLYDVPSDHWAASAIQACVDNGYMLTVGFGGFSPEQAATRGELAYAIAAILDVEDLEPIFVNSTDLINSDFRCSMEQLLRLGIMDGYSDGTAKPNAKITRAEAVTIINSYLFRGELNVYGNTYNFETGYNYGGNGTILSFTDLTTSHWAYGHIMEATNNHKYERILDGNERML